MSSFLHPGLGFTPNLFDNNTIYSGLLLAHNFNGANPNIKNPTVGNLVLTKAGTGNDLLIVPGFNGNAIRGSNSAALSASPATGLNTLKLYSFSVRVNFNSTQPSNAFIASIWEWQLGRRQMFLRADNGQLDLNLGDANGNYQVSRSVFLTHPVDSEWHLIEARVSESRISIALDGGQFTSNNPNTGLYIGALASQPNAISPNTSFQQDIDNFYFWNRDLTDKERPFLLNVLELE